jgi:hypothetical protein
MGTNNTKPSVVNTRDKRRIEFYDRNVKRLFTTTNPLEWNRVHVINSDILLSVGVHPSYMYLFTISTRKWSERIDPVTENITKIVQFNEMVLFLSNEKVVIWDYRNKTVFAIFNFSFVSEAVPIDDSHFAVYEADRNSSISIFNVHRGRTNEFSIEDLSNTKVMHMKIFLLGNILCAFNDSTRQNSRKYFALYDITTGKRIKTEHHVQHMSLNDNLLIYSKRQYNEAELKIYSLVPFRHLRSVVQKSFIWDVIHDDVVCVLRESGLYIYSLLNDTYVGLPCTEQHYVTNIAQVTDHKYYIATCKDVNFYSALFGGATASSFLYNKVTRSVTVLNSKSLYLERLETLKPRDQVSAATSEPCTLRCRYHYDQ